MNFTLKHLDNLRDMFFLLDADGKVLHMNKTAKNFLGNSFDGGDVRIQEILVSDDAEKFTSAFDYSIHSKKRQDILVRINNGNQIINADLSISCDETIADGKETVLVQLRDVTSERKKEMELLRFYYVAENSVNPLQITDIDGRMIYVNPAFVAVSGYNRDELLGQSPKIFGSGKHSKKFWGNMLQTINGGKVWFGEVENRRKNGEPFYTQLLISPIINSEGKVTGFFGIHRDLSEKRLLEKQLIHTQKMESIGTLAAGIAHEVGNPLASISALVQVAQRSTDDPFINEKLGLVKSQVTRISKIIRDLVDFSRPSNYELQLTDININIREAVEITKVGTKAKDIIFEMLLNEQIPLLPLIADQVQQVFVNILLNAVDAIIENHIDGKPEKITVKSDIIQDNVIISFSDTGKGISEENFVKVFEPFFTTKKEGKGTGLGLWVSYGIVKSFQGDIQVQSKKDVGTTFTITLPVQT